MDLLGRAVAGEPAHGAHDQVQARRGHLRGHRHPGGRRQGSPRAREARCPRGPGGGRAGPGRGGRRPQAAGPVPGRSDPRAATRSPPHIGSCGPAHHRGGRRVPRRGRLAPHPARALAARHRRHQEARPRGPQARGPDPAPPRLQRQPFQRGSAGGGRRRGRPQDHLRQGSRGAHHPEGRRRRLDPAQRHLDVRRRPRQHRPRLRARLPHRHGGEPRRLPPLQRRRRLHLHPGFRVAAPPGAPAHDPRAEPRGGVRALWRHRLRRPQGPQGHRGHPRLRGGPLPHGHRRAGEPGLPQGHPPAHVQGPRPPGPAPGVRALPRPRLLHARAQREARAGDRGAGPLQRLRRGLRHGGPPRRPRRPGRGAAGRRQAPRGHLPQAEPALARAAQAAGRRRPGRPAVFAAGLQGRGRTQG